MIEKITKALGGVRVNSIMRVDENSMVAQLDVSLDEYIAARGGRFAKRKYGESDVITTSISWLGEIHMVFVFGSGFKEFYKFDRCAYGS
jgi:hypothetical protein